MVDIRVHIELVLVWTHSKISGKTLQLIVRLTYEKNEELLTVGVEFGIG